MRLIDCYDLLVEIGRIDAGRNLYKIASRSSAQTLDYIFKMIPGKGLERHYADLMQVLGLPGNMLPPWPIKALQDWDMLVAEVDRAIHSNDPGLEIYWRIARLGGFLLWAEIPEEDKGSFRDMLNPLSLSPGEAEAVVADLSSSEKTIRLLALERLRDQIGAHGGQRKLLPNGAGFSA